MKALTSTAKVNITLDPLHSRAPSDFPVSALDLSERRHIIRQPTSRRSTHHRASHLKWQLAAQPKRHPTSLHPRPHPAHSYHLQHGTNPRRLKTHHYSHPSSQLPNSQRSRSQQLHNPLHHPPLHCRSTWRAKHLVPASPHQVRKPPPPPRRPPHPQLQPTLPRRRKGTRPLHSPRRQRTSLRSRSRQ